MEAGGGRSGSGSGGEKSRLRCLIVTRYVVAAVMAVLIVGVTFNTVKLLIAHRRFLRHPHLFVSVVRGTVYVRRASATPAALTFYMGVRVSSDQVSSARAINYFLVNSTAYLFDENVSSPPPSSKRPERTAIFSDQGPHDAKAVQQEGSYYFLMEAKGTRDTMNASYFDVLYGGGSILTSLWLNGTLVTELRSGTNTTYPRNITYYNCSPLIVTAVSNEAARYNDDDVPCVEVSS